MWTRFIAKRQYLAERVWETMEANNSLECRNCHDFTYMDNAKQSSAGIASHKKAVDENLTCINCHKGIAHQLPEEFLEQEHERFKEEDVECGQCHANLHLSEDSDWY